MILFIAPNPNRVKKREGYLQRVATIDGLFEGEVRVYYEDLQEDSRSLAEAMTAAEMIYVHSVYQASKILDSYPIFANKIVTDLHGIVPEEEDYAGNDQQAQRMAQVEREVFRHCKKFVAVSRAMARYYKKKYKLSGSVEWVILPIFNLKPSKLDLQRKEKSKTVIYAGGAQRWQNVGLMVDAINKTYEKYSFEILTHAPDAFSGIVPEALARITLQAVESSKVADHYKDAALGFVLRDDIPLNSVACPTKLIEYLSYGVVPIVLSPSIGDFTELGYEYILLSDFINADVSSKKLLAMMQKNSEVINRLEDLAKSGRKDLISFYQKLKLQPGNLVTSWETEAVVKSLEISKLDEKLAAYEYQISIQVKMIEQYAELAKQRQNELNKILYSRSWLAMRALRKPSILLGHFHKRSRE